MFKSPEDEGNEHENTGSIDAPERAGGQPFTKVEVAVLAWLMRAGEIIALPLVALAVSVVWDFGREVDQAFYGAVAQIAPVLLLTAIAEIALSALRPERAKANKQLPKDVRWALDTIPVRIVVAYFVMAEATSLYAVAANRSSTFLLLLCGLALWAQVSAVINLVLTRVGAEPLRGPLELVGVPLQALVKVLIILPILRLIDVSHHILARLALAAGQRVGPLLERLTPPEQDVRKRPVRRAIALAISKVELGALQRLLPDEDDGSKPAEEPGRGEAVVAPVEE